MSATQSCVCPDLASAPELVAECGLLLGRPMHLSWSTGSTNDDAKRAAKEGAPHGSTWVAETQTAGRGRQGRAWVAAPGESLLFSVLLRDAVATSQVSRIALVAGLAVREAVARAAPRAVVRIKWPNDVTVGGRKIAGVLTEATSVGPRVEAVVVGVGVNVHTRAFPPALSACATSVVLASPGASRPPDRAGLLADILASFDRDLHLVAARGLGVVRARLEAADALRGRRVRSDGGDEGVAAGIDDDGRLLVLREGGALARWSAGEVHLLG